MLEDSDDPKEAGLQREKPDLKSICGPSVLVLTSSLAQTLCQKEGSRGVECVLLQPWWDASVPSNLDMEALGLTS